MDESEVGELGYDKPDTRFWAKDDLRHSIKCYDHEAFRELYNDWMPREKPVIEGTEVSSDPKIISMIQENIISMERPILLLDIGCANGALGYTLLKLGIVNTFIGIDISDKEIEIARQTGLNLGLSENTFLYPVSLEDFGDMPYYNVITLCEGLEHFYSVNKALEKICMILNAKGIFCGTVPYMMICDALPHLHYFTVESLDILLKQYFKSVLVEKINVYEGCPTYEPEYHLYFMCKEAINGN